MSKYSHINIEWSGEILAIHGYGVTARRILKPLIEGGATVKLTQDEDYVPEHKRIKDPFWLEQLEKSKTLPDPPVKISYCIPPLFKPRQGAINILSSQWETTHFPKEWIPTINRADRFWVGTPSLKQSAMNSGVSVPIGIMNATIDPTEWNIEGEVSNITEIPANAVKFMFIADWIPRKNYEDLIIGYLTAFSGVSDTALVIKTWSNVPGIPGRKNIEETIKHFSNKLIGIDKPKIYLITDLLPEDQLIALMRGCDVYTSVSHGEGFDLPMVQAMSLGKIIVSTPFLAHGDYLNGDNSLPVRFTMSPVYDAVAPLYHAYQLWSKPDMWDYINKLRTAYQMVKSNKHKDMGLKARDTIEKLFSPENNTPLIVEEIEKAYKKPTVSTTQAIANAVAGLL